MLQILQRYASSMARQLKYRQQAMICGDISNGFSIDHRERFWDKVVGIAFSIKKLITN